MFSALECSPESPVQIAHSAYPQQCFTFAVFLESFADRIELGRYRNVDETETIDSQSRPILKDCNALDHINMGSRCCNGLYS
jgi:hypothetical protein